MGFGHRLKWHGGVDHGLYFAASEHIQYALEIPPVP
jgi:hypothetical protein